MNNSRRSLTIEECKIQASILLKSLRSNDLEKANQAAKRFQRLPEFETLSFNEINQADIKRKHALVVIALEKGFKSWSALICQIPFIRGGFLNQWFANYADAKSYLQSEGGFLLPYKNQFFVCDSHCIENLGFNPQDPDWKLIGYDWEHPENHEAWQRLHKKWMKIQGGKHE